MSISSSDFRHWPVFEARVYVVFKRSSRRERSTSKKNQLIEQGRIEEIEDDDAEGIRHLKHTHVSEQAEIANEDSPLKLRLDSGNLGGENP